jgi:hypothetical protein
MNKMGEEIENIKLIENDAIKIILIKRTILDKLLCLGDWLLIRYFGYTLSSLSSLDFFKLNEFDEEICEINDGQYLKCKIYSSKQKSKFIEYKGAHIADVILPEQDLLSLCEDKEIRKYGDFIVYDFKNGKILENYSISPENLSNYFTKSPLPYEMSPIFFRAEVLDKYKNDHDKYSLTERTIGCRGGWFLETYDINEFNQVHTYAIYLSRLPYKEQQHWKLFNEKPKGGISKRAIMTDFEGMYCGSSPLNRLKHALEQLGNITCTCTDKPIWIPKGGDWSTAAKGLFYVNAENANQWHDFIVTLANATIEGLQTNTLKEIAIAFGYKTDLDFRSLGLIKYILEKTNNEKYLTDTHGILNDLQKARGQGKAHGAWKRPDGSLIEDAKTRLEKIINAVEKLTVIFDNLKV